LAAIEETKSRNKVKKQKQAAKDKLSKQAQYGAFVREMFLPPPFAPSPKQACN
jgi:hypothetical protein